MVELRRRQAAYPPRCTAAAC